VKVIKFELILAAIPKCCYIPWVPAYVR